MENTLGELEIESSCTEFKILRSEDTDFDV